jgi:hypothetical protein
MFLLQNDLRMYFSKKVNNRLQNTLTNDRDMRIRINLVDVLILLDPIDTPWTNTTLYGVPGYPGDNNFNCFHNNVIICFSLVYRNRSTILATESAGAFANAMNSMNLSISYDYAIAFMK